MSGWIGHTSKLEASWLEGCPTIFQCPSFAPSVLSLHLMKFLGTYNDGTGGIWGLEQLSGQPPRVRSPDMSRRVVSDIGQCPETDELKKEWTAQSKPEEGEMEFAIKYEGTSGPLVPGIDRRLVGCVRDHYQLMRPGAVETVRTTLEPFDMVMRGAGVKTIQGASVTSRVWR